MNGQEDGGMISNLHGTGGYLIVEHYTSIYACFTTIISRFCFLCAALTILCILFSILSLLICHIRGISIIAIIPNVCTQLGAKSKVVRYKAQDQTRIATASIVKATRQLSLPYVQRI